MASEEERAKIMAEYLAGADQGEDEPDFDPTDEDPEESDAYEDDSADEGGRKDRAPKQPENYAVLDGHVSLNDEGRVSYSGTWAMKKDLDAAASAAANASDKGDKDEEEKKDGEQGSGKKSKKKKQKFKLKSKQIMTDSGPIFLQDNPTVSKKKDPQTIPSKRTMLFDGFFFTPEDEGHKKIKEKDVEITFSVIEGEAKSPSGEETTENAGRSFKVEGKGSNEFGAFTIDGTYKATATSSAGDSPSKGDGKSRTNSLVANKKYVPVACRADDDDEDDDEMSDAAEADYGELIALNEEANMSVEELRKRYYGGHADDDVDDAKPKAKKAKIIADDSDDGCGF